jgi:predicted acylesterase/phospholipase RssA
LFGSFGAIGRATGTEMSYILGCSEGNFNTGCFAKSNNQGLFVKIKDFLKNLKFGKIDRKITLKSKDFE